MVEMNIKMNRNVLDDYFPVSVHPYLAFCSPELFGLFSHCLTVATQGETAKHVSSIPIRGKCKIMFEESVRENRCQEFVSDRLGSHSKQNPDQYAQFINGTARLLVLKVC